MSRKKTATEANGFSAWWANYKNLKDPASLTEGLNLLVDLTLPAFGISDFRFLEETDITKVRLIIAELIMTRPLHPDVNLRLYLAAIETLTGYTEYLVEKYGEIKTHYNSSLTEDLLTSEKKAKRRSGKSVKTEKKEEKKPVKKSDVKEPAVKTNTASMEDILTVCYYLSREDLEGCRKLGYPTFREAFVGLGAILGKPPSSIKAARDEFDPFFNNGRKGFNRPLTKSRENIFNKYAQTGSEELTHIVKQIIEKHSTKQNPEKGQDTADSTNPDIADSPSSTKRKRIVISSDKTKDIPSKKKR